VGEDMKKTDKLPFLLDDINQCISSSGPFGKLIKHYDDPPETVAYYGRLQPKIMPGFGWGILRLHEVQLP
jgi:hypothetical protein